MKYLADVLTLLGSGAILHGVYGIYPPAAWILAGGGVLAIGLRFAQQEAKGRPWSRQ